MKTIIEMAREAGGVDITSKGWTSWVGTQSTEFLERFVELVRADEREACAKVCENNVSPKPQYHWWSDVCRMLASAIRARGNT